MKKIALAVLVVFILNACSRSQAPIKVELLTRISPFMNMFIPKNFIKITSLEDSVKITKITPNKGNCKVGGFIDNNVNITLKYGQSRNIALRCEDLLEVDIQTDKGTWNFTF